MTKAHKGFLILGLGDKTISEVSEIAGQVSNIVIGGPEVFYSGDHKEMMTTSALVADLYESFGFEIQEV